MNLNEAPIYPDKYIRLSSEIRNYGAYTLEGIKLTVEEIKRDVLNRFGLQIEDNEVIVYSDDNQIVFGYFGQKDNLNYDAEIKEYYAYRKNYLEQKIIEKHNNKILKSNMKIAELKDAAIKAEQKAKNIVSLGERNINGSQERLSNVLKKALKKAYKDSVK